MIAGIQDEILRLHAMGLLEPLLMDKTTKGHILWATDGYAERGLEYRRNRQISAALITGEHANVIRTRARKALELQEERTRRRAEVFTPLWICDRMVSLGDAAWFRRKLDYRTARSMGAPVRFTKHRTWKHYVDSRRLEITCGEAPFLVSRYDAATGEAVPIEYRTGVLDRKLRAVSDGAADEAEWMRWALRAFQSVYGYEFQGDNLLIARVNLLMTFEEYLAARWRRRPAAGEYQAIIRTIVWNLWQMDGLTGKIPYCREDDWEETSLFDHGAGPEQQDKLNWQPWCRIYDWRRDNSLLYRDVNTGGRTMKFDFIIGNPPYQDGESASTRKPPIYHLFMEAVYPLADKVELITPARFLFNAGQTPKAWNKKMLADPHLKVLHYESDGTKIFPHTDIKGGIAITYRDAGKIFGAIENFTSHDELNHILKKVKEKEAESFSSIVYSQGLYRFSEAFFEDYPQAKSLMGAGTGYKIVSNVLDKIPEAFTPTPTQNSLKMLGRMQNARIYRYISRKYIAENDGIDTYNVFVPEGNGSGTFGEPLATPVIGEPGVGHTDTFLSIGHFSSEAEALACMKYIKTRFARTLLGILKVTQHNPPSTWKYVPLQDFTSSSDIDWSQSVADIDRQLYAKYGLDEKEVAFIESHVKEMK